MSVHVSSWAWRLDVGDPETKLVLLKLADHADDRGYCYPSIDLIVRDTCLSRSTVIRRLKRLEELGYLQRTRQREGSRNLSNRYQLVRDGDSVSGTPSTGTSEFHVETGGSVPGTPEPSGNRQSSFATAQERASGLYDALVAACYPADAVLSAREKRKVALAANNIASAGGTAALVPAVRARYLAHNSYGKCVLTAMALSEHWAELAPASPSAACPECDLRGGRHTADCSRLAA